MRRTARFASCTALALTCLMALSGGDAFASGVGASIYVPAPNRPQVQQASCQLGACGPAGCNDCERLGFAGVDPASVPPCTAEGACYPKRSTFGYYATRWRTWPGADYGGPAPTTAGPSDNIPAFETPAPEDEDKQAPPPIEETESPSAESEGEEGPGVEINLPPLPDGPLPTTPRPARPQPNRPQGGPPALPFGFAPPTEPSSSGPSDWRPAPSPVSVTPTKLPQPAAVGSDGPPPLPFGFTSVAPQQMLRRLPVANPPTRYDGSIRQVSAQSPIR